MKKLILISLVLLLVSSCTAPEFVVTAKKPTSDGNCLAEISPVNKKAKEHFYEVTTALIDCWDYEVNSHIFLKRKEFTNFHRSKKIKE